MTISLSPQDWLDFFVHFASLSLLGIGGAITTAPDMHRYLVDEKNWLTDATFSSSIALAQSAPGPNVLFVALMGWQVGLNAGGGFSAGASAWGLGLMGVALHGPHCDWPSGVNWLDFVGSAKRLCQELEAVVGHSHCHIGRDANFHSLAVVNCCGWFGGRYRNFVG
jgi:hypothetical protein